PCPRRPGPEFELGPSPPFRVSSAARVTHMDRVRVRLRLRLRQLLDRWRAGRPPSFGANRYEKSAPIRVSSDGLRTELVQDALSKLPQRVYWKDLDCVYRGCNHKFL